MGKRRCKLCLVEGHYAKTCPNKEHPQVLERQKKVLQVKANKKKRAYICKVCGQDGHQQRTCPLRKNMINAGGIATPIPHMNQGQVQNHMFDQGAMAQGAMAQGTMAQGAMAQYHPLAYQGHAYQGHAYQGHVYPQPQGLPGNAYQVHDFQPQDFPMPVSGQAPEQSQMQFQPQFQPMPGQAGQAGQAMPHEPVQGQVPEQSQLQNSSLSDGFLPQHYAGAQPYNDETNLDVDKLLMEMSNWSEFPKLDEPTQAMQPPHEMQPPYAMQPMQPLQMAPQGQFWNLPLSANPLGSNPLNGNMLNGNMLNGNPMITANPSLNACHPQPFLSNSTETPNSPMDSPPVQTHPLDSSPVQTQNPSMNFEHDARNSGMNFEHDARNSGMNFEHVLSFGQDDPFAQENKEIGPAKSALLY